jgi:hypothetical protein
MVIHFRQENAIFGYILYYFGGRFFSISSNVLRNIENGFWTQFLLHNSCYLSNDSVFPKNLYVFTHLHLFEWRISSRCFLWNHMSGTLHIELKWDNELICNIKYFIKFGNCLNGFWNIFAFCNILVRLQFFH